MPTLDDDHTGARIREQRRLARLTQRGLSDRIPYSYSLLNQVECGARPATDDFVDAVARALKVEVTVLTGQHMQHDRLTALVRPIREALDLYDIEPTAAATRSADDLSAEADFVCQQVRATHLHKAATALPGIITELTCLGFTSPTTSTWQALASSYRTAADIALKLGYPDLSTVALDRMSWAAERASDPCLAAVRQYKRALAYKDGEHDIGRRLIASGHEMLAGESSREALVVAGQLHLGASAVAARAGDQGAVEGHIAAAREFAVRVGGEAGAVHWLSFGLKNVALHEMGASMSLRQYDHALVQARKLNLPPSTLTSRRARFLVDRAVVEMETGHTDAALRHLIEARRAAPEQTRYLPGTRAAVTGLVHLARRTPDTLSQMASWVGM
ncbi:helix-turn-helix domain-containing protein [Streptomyces sp. NBC_00440]|uniref:helix-turn-helix domain-containing protein n=1 Tax=unclassified Streptomyces TaxID=2593676 RepID=UPI002E1F5F0F|nr:helix-turn-helix domain-containing protein [Streptomyces sp. NBC_00932]